MDRIPLSSEVSMLRRSITAFLMLGLLPAGAPADIPPPMAGDPAPPILVSGWAHGGPIDTYEPGQVYVLDFWSTWCVPCIAGFGEMSRLQEAYAQEVVVLGVDIWEFVPDRVPAFIDTHRDSMGFIVAFDSVSAGSSPDQGYMARSYLGVSDITSIPNLWIVDGEGRLAWFGKPDQMHEPLRQILAGEWDLEAYAAEYRKNWETQNTYLRLSAAFKRAIEESAWGAAYAAAESAVALGDKYRWASAHGEWSTLGKAIVQQDAPSPDDLDIAERALTNALAINEAWNPARVLLSQVYVGQGRTEKARQVLEQALTHATDEEAKAELRERIENISAGP